MGLFDFLNPSKRKTNKIFEKIHNEILPNGDTDIDAGVKELMIILNGKIDANEAENIIMKSVYISRVTENFDKERLRRHLQGYCLQHFNENQLEQFYRYLFALNAAKIINGKGPSGVKKVNGKYSWE